MARAFGLDPMVSMERPYDETLWSLMELRDLERLDAFRDESRALMEAGLISLAFNEPKKLGDASEDLKRRMRVGGYAETAADAKARALAQIAADAAKQRDLDALAAAIAETQPTAEA